MILLDQSGAAAKESKLFSPSRSLASFVEHFWVQQTLSGPIGPSWRVIPEANPNLIKGRGDVCDMGCGPGHIARYLRGAGVVNVFGLNVSPQMVEQARQLNQDISFQVGNGLALDLREASLGGIVAFYAIVNIPENLLPTAFGEMWRVLKPGGRLLLSFHIGDESVRPDELLGQPVSIDFFFFQPAAIINRVEATGFAIEDIVERGPYAPEVEYQSRRAYIFAAKPE